MITIRPNSRIVAFGHSIVRGSTSVPWWAPFVSRMRAAYTAARSGVPSYGQVPDNATLAAGVGPGVPFFTAAGYPGDRMDQILTKIGSIYALDPTHVIVDCEVNDVDQEFSNTTFSNSIDAIVAGLRANCPNLQGIVFQQDVCSGEVRPFGSNPHDTTSAGFAAKDAIMVARCAANGVDLVQMRTDSSGNGPWLTYETAHNTNNASVGPLTFDGIHPKTHSSTAMVGQNFICDQLMPLITFAGVG